MECIEYRGFQGQNQVVEFILPLQQYVCLKLKRDLKIEDKDLRIDSFRGSGAGGAMLIH